jgi:hypothetical protein
VNHQDKLKKLREAWALVKAVANDMEGGAKACASCGLKKYEDQAQYQAKELLVAAEARIEKVASRIKAEPAKFNGTVKKV